MNENELSLLEDSNSRNLIVSETDENYFVEAGAGSGKTTMLVSRMVAMIEQGKDIKKICAITFTKAAAGEFRERFQKLLIERSNANIVWESKGYAGELPAPTTESRKLCEQALKDIDLCFMGTIDSFCQMILSEHPSEAGIPSDATVLNQIDMELIYEQIFIKICNGDYGKELADYAALFRMVSRNPEMEFVKGMSLFMNNRNFVFDFQRMKCVTPDVQFKKLKDLIISTLQFIQTKEELVSDATIESHEIWRTLSNTIRNLKRNWDHNFLRTYWILKRLSNLKLCADAVKNYPEKLGDLFYEEYRFCSNKFESVCDLLLEYQYGISMSFFEKCVPSIEKNQKEKGNFSYFDFLLYLRNMLKKDAENEGILNRYIYDRHSYFLIDEFQDTNPIQAEIFFYLSTLHPVGDWTRCIPRKGSLFIVGDPKQSIYRFRSADVASFLNVKNLFQNNSVGKVLSLSRNFRSTKVLCEYYNRVFTRLLPEEMEEQSKYKEIPIVQPDKNEFQGVYCYETRSGKNNQFGNAISADWVQIRKTIMKLVDNPQYMITPAGESTPRKITYGDIMVISYGKEWLSYIMDELDNYNIPMHVEGKVPFERNDALNCIYDIYCVFANPKDRMAIYKALTGNILRFGRSDITGFLADGGVLSLYPEPQLKETASEKSVAIADALRTLNQFSYQAGKMSPAAVFQLIMEQFRIYKYTPAENMEVLYYTLEMMRNAEKSGALVSLPLGASYIARLLSGEADEERCLSLVENKDCVHLANLHKVKGLEAPIVILAYSYDFTPAPGIRLDHRANPNKASVFYLYQEVTGGGNYVSYVETSKLRHEQGLERMSLECEGKRLIYVAATRARNALIICNSYSVSKTGKKFYNGRWKSLVENPAALIVAEGEADRVCAAKTKNKKEASVLYDEAARNNVLNNRSAEEESYKIVTPSTIKVPTKLANEETTYLFIPTKKDDKLEDNPQEETKEKSLSHEIPEVLGTMVHRLMEIMVSSGDTRDIDLTVDEIIREYRQASTEPYEVSLADDLRMVAWKIRNGGYTQKNHAPTDILSVLLSAEEVYCEVPFSYLDEEKGEDGENIIWNGVMDVIYKSEGKWHIVDYKTNADGNNLDHKYQEQLRSYIKAFKFLTGEDADAMIYHIEI